MAATTKAAPHFDAKETALELLHVIRGVLDLLDHTTPEGRPIVGQVGTDLRARLAALRADITGEDEHEAAAAATAEADVADAVKSRDNPVV